MTIRAFFKNNLSIVLRFFNGLKRPSRKKNLARLQKSRQGLESFTIRAVKSNEIKSLAELHVKTWNETYRGPGRKPTLALRESQWREVFNNDDGSWFCLFVVSGNDIPVGFVYGKKYDRPDILPFDGQISKIYILQQYTRLGLGRRLVLSATREFLKRGMNSMLLFGSPHNPSCAFHEAMGGKRLLSETGTFDGGYGWTDLNALLKRQSHDNSFNSAFWQNSVA
jgi:ribosomal protein S18 acetylase RimI-like enzyme